MSKRKYTHLQEMEAEILQMRESGKTKREIAEHFGLTTEQVKGLLKRHRRRERKMEAGIMLRPKGRPQKDGQPPQNEKREIEQQRMENKLLRDFLQLTGRK